MLTWNAAGQGAWKQVVTSTSDCEEMDLLGSYGGDSDESLEENQEAGSGNAGEAGAADSLSKIVGYSHADESGGRASHEKSNPSLADQLCEKLGAANYSDESARKARNPAVRALSKSSTPVVGSPGGILPSDASSPESAERSWTPVLVSEHLPQVELPPAPTSEIEPKLIENVNKYTRLREKDRKKEFHNPGILEVLMATYNIDGYGSNYPKELFDPAGYSPNMFYDSLRRQAAFKEEMKLATRTRVDFDSGGLQLPDAKRPLVQLSAAGGSAGLDAAADENCQTRRGGSGASGIKGCKGRASIQVRTRTVVCRKLIQHLLAATGIAIADLKRVQQLQQQAGRR
eukprot:767026-Hanusia_phi.AAC.5